jgi:RNA polymerase sigma factor (sigma-70 family)
MGEMQEKPDAQLLREYAENGREAAFREIVERHTDLVYSAAFRQVGSPDLARDISQSVFVDLARKAKPMSERLSANASLIGWLYRSTRFAVLTQLRDDRRRSTHGRQAMEQLITDSGPTQDWERIRPLLDEAMAELSDDDREAVLLRYFKNHDFRTVGQTIGTSDDAAQKRVSRAVEHLREFFSNRGVTIGATGMVVVISANAVQAAPIGLTATISTTAILAGTTIQTSAAIAATKVIAMTTLQKALVTTTIAVLAGTGIFEAHKSSLLQAQILALQQQQASRAEQDQRLQQQRDADLENASNTHGDNSELLKLRAEVTSLREQLKGLPSARVALLKQKFDAMPNKKIPEFQFLTDKDWLKVAWDADLDTDDGVRSAMRDLRDKATDEFMNLMRTALKSYIASHDGMLPPDLLAVESYFQVPVTDEMLQHYELVQTGALNNDWSQPLVKKILQMDPDYDSNQQMSMSGGSGNSWNNVQRAVQTAAAAFSADNGGQFPTDPSQITSYLQSPIDSATVQKYLAEVNSDPPPPEVVPLMPALRAYADAHNGQYPDAPSALQPYITTDQEKAALAQAMTIYAASHH